MTERVIDEHAPFRSNEAPISLDYIIYLRADLGSIPVYVFKFGEIQENQSLRNKFYISLPNLLLVICKPSLLCAQPHHHPPKKNKSQDPAHQSETKKEKPKVSLVYISSIRVTQHKTLVWRGKTGMAGK